MSSSRGRGRSLSHPVPERTNNNDEPKANQQLSTSFSPPKTTETLLNLFSPPPTSPLSTSKPTISDLTTERNDDHSTTNESTPLLTDSVRSLPQNSLRERKLPVPVATTTTKLKIWDDTFVAPTTTEDHSIVSLSPKSQRSVMTTKSIRRNQGLLHEDTDDESCIPTSWRTWWKTTRDKIPMGNLLLDPTNWVGSLVFLLYHMVFCLAMASAIRRPNSSVQSTGELAQLAALGVIVAGPVQIFASSPQIPAVYPTSDLFLAPFLAHMAVDVDESLTELGLQNDSAVFLGTFGALFVTSMALSGVWCLVAARIRLANIGHFLPNPVLTGFFTTIGILMYTLGFSVDSGGLKPGQVFLSGDWDLILTTMIHHAPSLLIGTLMHFTNPFHPTMVIGWIALTIIGSFTLMGFMGIDLSTAQENHWFFSPEDLQSSISHDGDSENPAWLSSYPIGFPFGIWINLLQGNVSWIAYRAGIKNMLALAVLYLIRCSLHAAALKKNIPNVTRVEDAELERKKNDTAALQDIEKAAIDEHSTIPGEVHHVALNDTQAEKAPNKAKDEKQKLALGYILEHCYSYAQLASAFVGGIGVGPAIAASVTLFQLGAEKSPPQYGSCLLMVFVYFSDFDIVQYIPKVAFSSLMVLAGLDMTRAWLIKSYFLTKSKEEWMVAPILVVLAFWLGLLNAIFVGVAISTFWFAASFHRAGVVKYVGNGISLRSTVERGFDQVAWLDDKADLIQILVLQNYLFFGNVQGVSNYVQTMFEEYVCDPEDDTGAEDEAFDYIPPLPQHLVLDFTFVTGMDTSSVDLIKDILAICKANNCKLYFAGMSSELRSILVHAKVVTVELAKGALDRESSQDPNQSMFYVDLESALAKAEDDLMSKVFHLELRVEEEARKRQRSRSLSNAETGFSYALDQILIQHGDVVSEAVEKLRALAPKTVAITLEAGDVLAENEGGLFFVETGLMRVRHKHADSSVTSSGKWSGSGLSSTDKGGFAMYDGRKSSLDTLSGWNARSVGRQAALIKQKEESMRLASLPEDDPSSAIIASIDPFIKDHSTFRLARIGHGWVTGSLPLSSSGDVSSVYFAVSSCRLHHLPHDVLLELEETSPDIVMHLYKLLAFLRWKRQEMTIGQLSQFVRIMTSPVPRLRRGKSDLRRLQAKSLYMR